jgi:predicted GNAT family N-acyltransferase
MLKLEVLDKSHDRTAFDCGREPLNRFLREVARMHMDRGISQTFVLVDDQATSPKTIHGFFSLSACEAESAYLPAKLAKKYPSRIAAVRLGRLAISLAEQGKGLGTDLISMALVKTAETAARIGVAGLFVDAKDDALTKFYTRFGFESLPDNPLTMFLPIQNITGGLS